MKKKTILITGGANGIGKEISKLYLKEKYNVIIIDNNLTKIDKDKSKNIYYYNGDVSNKNQIHNIMKDIAKKFESIDVLINNAAKQIISSFDNLNYSDWKEVIDTNLNGTFLVTKEALYLMKEKATILNIISVHHDKPRKYKYSYDVTKAAIALLTKELALEFAQKNITINALSFGAVKTNMNKDWLDNPHKVKKVLNKTPLKKIFEPSEIAKFAKTIINEFSQYTTGTIFTIDAGRSLLC